MREQDVGLGSLGWQGRTQSYTGCGHRLWVVLGGSGAGWMKGLVWPPRRGLVSHPEGMFGAPNFVFSPCHLREKTGGVLCGALDRCPAVPFTRPNFLKLLPAPLRLGMGERGRLQGAGVPDVQCGCRVWPCLA